MKYVEFKGYVGVGVVETLGRIVWEKGKLFAEGKRTDILKKLLDDPVRNLKMKGCPVFTRKDGLQFLEALPYFYMGGRLCASVVKEEK